MKRRTYCQVLRPSRLLPRFFSDTNRPIKSVSDHSENNLPSAAQTFQKSSQTRPILPRPPTKKTGLKDPVGHLQKRPVIRNFRKFLDLFRPRQIAPNAAAPPFFIEY
jgi:hypothetical protein